jgi:predicted dehydrogenase
MLTAVAFDSNELSRNAAVRTESQPQRGAAGQVRPRLGFLGVGWIGRHRLQAILDDECADVIAVADASSPALCEARAMVASAAALESLDQLLAMELDGIVIATPSALHAEQAEAALERGVAVFCQKPLARTSDECRRIIDAARNADRLLAVDLSYRYAAAMRVVRGLVANGDLGKVYAIDLVFHNAYGPDKPWFRNAALSGGGCVIDLGTHLIDLALWTCGFPTVRNVSSRLYAHGCLLDACATEVEDFALAQMDIGDGTVARLACSWNLSAGCDAVIEATFHGTHGTASFHNVNGSFYDFVAERFEGTSRTTLATPPDSWGGRAAVAWARRLASNPAFDPEIESLLPVVQTIDAVYGR